MKKLREAHERVKDAMAALDAAVLEEFQEGKTYRVVSPSGRIVSAFVINRGYGAVWVENHETGKQYRREVFHFLDAEGL